MGLVLLASALTPAGLVCIATGVILWLCEQSWVKPHGSMGSYRLLSAGLLLNLPLIVILVSWVFSLRFGG